MRLKVFLFAHIISISQTRFAYKTHDKCLHGKHIAENDLSNEILLVHTLQFNMFSTSKVNVKILD